MLKCNDGFVPIEEMTATCTGTLMWNPDPNTFVCTPLPTTVIPTTGEFCICSLPHVHTCAQGVD